MGESFWGDPIARNSNRGDGDADKWDGLLGDGLLLAMSRLRDKYLRGEPMTREEAEALGVEWQQAEEEAEKEGDDGQDDEELEDEAGLFDEELMADEDEWDGNDDDD